MLYASVLLFSFLKSTHIRTALLGFLTGCYTMGGLSWFQTQNIIEPI